MAQLNLSLLLLLCSVMLLVEGSWILGAIRPNEEEEFETQDLEKRMLVKDLDELEAVEKELERRSEVEDLYEELKEMNLQNQKRQEIRQTPVPGIVRLKMTPPPNVPGPIVRYDKTPPVPANLQPRQTPLPYPYNLINGPLRETPRPLRLTPVPNKPPGYPAEMVPMEERDLEMEQRELDQELEEQELELRRQLLIKKLLARRAYAERNRRIEEEEY